VDARRRAAIVVFWAAFAFLMLALYVPESTAALPPVPANYWTARKAVRVLEARERIFGRVVTVVRCHGTGSRVIRRNGVRFWRRLTCTIYHPTPSADWTLLLPRDRTRYQLLLIGGIS
jgi:hypothetical protein